jgi:hypothetical protein
VSQLAALPDPLRAILGGDALAPRPFPPASRYAGVGTLTLPAEEDGAAAVVYLERRFVPHPGRFATLREHLVVRGDRLDNVTARHLEDPEQFWQLCDANGALRPAELEAVGRRLRIPLPLDVPEPPSA